ncbi:MAG: C40 family peptidase [Bacteroidota bacterium]|nr:C40 family peptidase [Bacteroidota bacterium]
MKEPKMKHACTTPIMRVVLLCFGVFPMLMGCASLKPLPRFRTSSTSFAPDQLPLAHRSVSALFNASLVGAYSALKEGAAANSLPEIGADEKNMLIVNRSSSGNRARKDIAGLDRQELDDEGTANEEFGEEEPDAEEAFVQKLVHRDGAMESLDENEETNPAINRIEMMREIINLLGNPYRYGGMSAVHGLDCSAFVGTVYSRAFGVRLPRSSSEQFGTGQKVRKEEIKVGDLVFFKTRRRRAPVSHVGIYVGENLFAHASTRYGVIISPMDHGYYQKTFVGARRVLTSNLTELKRP